MMKRSKKDLPYFLIILLLSVYSPSFPARFHYSSPEELKFEHFSVADGMHANTIRAILQDHLGFLWFGSNNCLIRYDGYNFVKYFIIDSTRSDIHTAVIFDLSEDDLGNIWILTRFHGVKKWDRATGIFKNFDDENRPHEKRSSKETLAGILDSRGNLWYIAHYPSGEWPLEKMNTRTERVARYLFNPDDNTSISANQIMVVRNSWFYLPAIYETREGEIYVGTFDGGLNLYVPQSDAFIRFQHDPDDPTSLSDNCITSIFEDSRGNLWVGTDGGLNRFNKDEGSFERFLHDPDNPFSIANDVCYAVYEDKRHRLWISVGGGLDLFDEQSRTFSHYNPIEGDHESQYFEKYIPFYEDDIGMLYILSDGQYPSIFVFNPQDETFSRYAEDTNKENSLRAINFDSYAHDRSGVIWIGTEVRGLNKLDPQVQQFQNFILSSVDENSLGSNNVQVIYQSPIDSERVWIGTMGGGFDQYNVATHQFANYKIRPDNPRNLVENTVSGICQDAQGCLWIGTGQGMARWYKGKLLSFYRHDPNDPLTIAGDVVWSIFSDYLGQIWSTSLEGGLNLYHPENDSFERFLNDPEDSTTISTNSYLWHIFEDNNRELWIASNYGLNKFNRDQHNFTRYLGDYNIICTYVDQDNKFWLSAQGRGLVIFNPADGSHELVTTEQGLPDQNIQAIVEDRGFLWMSTFAGVVKCDPQNRTFVLFDERHGLPAKTFSQAVGKLRNGQIWMGTYDHGIIAFDPARLRYNTIPPQVVIVDFKLFNKSVKPGPQSPLAADISVTREIHLKHWQNDLTFECAALHFKHPAKNEYSFWLENYDPEWHKAGTSRIATYTNLDPGEYVFHAKAANCDGAWNEEGHSLYLVIHKPWYGTIAAYCMYLITSVMILYLILKSRLRRVTLRNELHLQHIETKKLQEIDQMKTRFLANISHEFRTPLTLILGPINRWLKISKSKELAADLNVIRKSAQRLLRLVNQLLELSKIEAGKLTLQTRCADLVSFTNRIVQTLESQAKLKQIELHIHVLNDRIQVYFDAEKIENVLYNLITNALKFTPNGGRVDVNIQTVKEPLSFSGTNAFPDGAIKISVQDTGIGISSDQLESIFDRFYQVRDNRPYSDSGTGIGLSLAKELVEMHHGRIVVKSELNSGSTFTVYLPLGRKHLRESEISPADEYHVTEPAADFLPTDSSTLAQGKIASSAPTILVVEDNDDLRAFIKAILGREYRLSEAHNGRDGFEQSIAHIPDLVISDVMMPEMNGFELCAKIKTDERTSHIPIILLTARADVQSKIHGLETGADDYLIKPFNEMELVVRAHNLITQREKLRQRFRRDILIPFQSIAITSADERFLQRAAEIIYAELYSSLNPELLSHKLGLSRSQLHRKLRALVNMSASEFIRSIRLRRAAELLQQNWGSVSEIAFEVGFSNPAFFSRHFRSQFGCSPRDYKVKR